MEPLYPGHCPHPVTVYIRGHVKGYIQVYYDHVPTVTEWGGSTQELYQFSCRVLRLLGFQGWARSRESGVLGFGPWSCKVQHAGDLLWNKRVTRLEAHCI